MADVTTIVIGQLEPHEDKYYTIEYWYDRYQRYWVIQVFNDIDVEVECKVGIHREGLKGEIEDFKATYHPIDVIHK